jgi:hypothetical protein
MKTKVLIIVGLALQLCFLLFVMVQAPEPHDGIGVGLKKLKENCPSQALTIINTTDKVWTLKTAGDFFYMADNWFQFIIKATICFVLINMAISVLLLMTLRKKTKQPLTSQSCGLN